MKITTHSIFRKGCSLATLLIGALVTMAVGVLSAKAAASSPWEKPRALTAFQALLDQSPFSLPTAEESSPLSDRYALTGIVTINGQEQVFVFDRTDQSRTLLTHSPNSNNMSLISLVREGQKLPQKATIRVGDDTGTIAFLEASQQPSGPMIPGAPGVMNTVRPPPGTLNLPPLPQRPGVISTTGPMPSSFIPQRRIIRRPMINPPPGQAIP